MQHRAELGICVTNRNSSSSNDSSSKRRRSIGKTEPAEKAAAAQSKIDWEEHSRTNIPPNINSCRAKQRDNPTAANGKYQAAIPSIGASTRVWPANSVEARIAGMSREELQPIFDGAMRANADKNSQKSDGTVEDESRENGLS